MTGINLHAIVRGPINYLHNDERVSWYRQSGRTASKGVQTALYENLGVWIAQIQTLSTDDLTNEARINESEISRHCYMISPDDSIAKQNSLVRPLGKSGDMIRRADGTWWRVYRVVEDFRHSGWQNLGIELQTTIPRELQDADS